jgi:cell division protein FtsI (penicillin-binding protein 3)
MGEPSRLVGRVAAILSTRRVRAPLGRAPTALVAAFTAVTVVAIACATPDAAASAAPSVAQVPFAPLASTGSVGSTIDPAIQAAADDELDRAVREWRAAAGVVVVLDPRTGEIRANAGRSRGARADVASTTAYVTGSTMKAVTLAAALDEGVVTPSDTFDCGHGSLSYGGQTIHDNDTYDTLGVSQMLAVSSNVGFARLFDRLGGERLARELRALHFGAAPGWVPDRIEDHSYAGAVAAMGEAVSATPLQVAAAYAAIANDGAYVSPTLAVQNGPPPREQVMKPETAHAVLAMLDEVVNGEVGTGKLARVAGVRVAGKTGTAAWDRPSGGEGRYASFVGVVPEASPEYVILVGIEQPRDGGSGGTVAAPVFSRVATRALAAHGAR